MSYTETARGRSAPVNLLESVVRPMRTLGMRILPAAAILGWIGSLLAPPAQAASDGEIEVRGTIRCVADDARKPVDTLCLAVEPAGFPSGAGVVDERGQFRVRVPLRFLDKKVFLRIYRGEDELTVFRVQLESKRLSNESSGATIEIGEHDLADACADLECDLLTAMALRERVTGAPQSTPAEVDAAMAEAERTASAPSPPAPVAGTVPVETPVEPVAAVQPTKPTSAAPSGTPVTVAPSEAPRDPVEPLASPSRGRAGEGADHSPAGEMRGTASSALLGGVMVAALSGFVAYDDEDEPRALPNDPLVDTEVDEFELHDEKTLNLAPGDWIAYARESSSPALGRATTSWSDPEETALWNPSANVFDSHGGLAFTFGSPTEMRMSALMRVPERATDKAAWVPRIVTLGFLQYRDDRDVRLDLESGPVVKASFTHEETIGVLGLGFALGERVALGANVHTYLQRMDLADGSQRTIHTYDDGSGTYQFTTQDPLTHWERVDESDVDLSLTWNAGSSHRVALVGTNLAGSEALRGDGSVVSLREAIVGYGWRSGRLRAGAEVTNSEEGSSVAAGANWLFRRGLAFDVAGGTRFGTVQGGVDVYIWKIQSKCRFRYDETEATAATVTFGARI